MSKQIIASMEEKYNFSPETTSCKPNKTYKVRNLKIDTAHTIANKPATVTFETI
jgi:hypothetical protein